MEFIQAYRFLNKLVASCNLQLNENTYGKCCLNIGIRGCLKSSLNILIMIEYTDSGRYSDVIFNRKSKNKDL